MIGDRICSDKNLRFPRFPMESLLFKFRRKERCNLDDAFAVSLKNQEGGGVIFVATKTPAKMNLHSPMYVCPRCGL